MKKTDTWFHRVLIGFNSEIGYVLHWIQWRIAWKALAHAFVVCAKCKWLIILTLAKSYLRVFDISVMGLMIKSCHWECKWEQYGVNFITVLRLICALAPTFEKLLRGVDCHAPNLNRAISMIWAVRPTFMKLTHGRESVWSVLQIVLEIWGC